MASHTLLSLVTRLQQVMSVAQGRAMLLDYARKSCGARLALLFLLDGDDEVLRLIEHSGRHPHPSSFAPEAAPVELSAQGLFGSALQQAGFVDVPDITLNPLSLPEERSLAWPHGRVLLHALRQVQQHGVLVFCFSPAGSRLVPDAQSEEELLICASLLSAYLGKEDDLQLIPPDNDPLKQPRKPARRPTRRTRVKSEQDLTAFQAQNLEGLLRPLKTLWEIGLLTGDFLERQELSTHLLQRFASAVQATSSVLWHYQAAQEAFQIQTFSGENSVLIERATRELNSLTRVLLTSNSEPAYGLLALNDEDEHILIWHTLRYHEQFPGVLGLVLTQQADFSSEQHLWFDAVCELLALILFHHDLHTRAQQDLLEEERNRIAREMHDSVIQDMAHVTQ
ncbi:MAG TPA: histidine kinase, partial [Ktedonobacteraceae bacterium]|nr:histidine kinase [Ktedonobacteraceae bacterium]